MHALKTASFLRPSSRPSSPLPAPHTIRADSDIGSERVARPHTKLSLSNFRKPSPAPNRDLAPTPLIQDGSYLEALGLKLGEAVSKALAHPTGAVGTGELLNGKRPIPAGSGRALGALIAAELNASNGNAHLQRAILRLLQRPLSVLLTNLSSLLLPLLSSPAFLNPPAPTPHSPHLNATQCHALALAHVAGELLETFEKLNLGVSSDPRGDGLRTIRDGLTSLLGRVVNPLVTGIKNELVPVIQALEMLNPAWTSASVTKAINGTKVVSNQHPSITSLHAHIPVYRMALTRYTASGCQAALATLLISLVWRGLVALSHRPLPPKSRPNSVSALTTTLSGASNTFRKRLVSSTTPPSTPPPGRFNMKLPPSRPPSPPSAAIPSTAADASALYDLLSLLPKPIEANDSSRVAQEAVGEAFEALAALTALLGATTFDTDVGDDLDLDLVTAGLPVLIALPILLRWAGRGEARMIPIMLGVSEIEYRDGCLSGFGRADECTGIVGQGILDVLGSENLEDTKTKMVTKWLEAKVTADR